MGLEKNSLEGKTDWELVTMLSKNDSSSVIQTEFFNRYKSFLLQICRKRCRLFDGGDQLAEDIFQNTMLKALNNIDSLLKKLSPDNTKISQHIKAWLATIARNEFREFLRKNPEEKKLSDPFRLKSDEIDDYKIKYELNENEEMLKTKPSFYEEELKKGLSILSDRERHILMVYMEYYDPQNINKHLPNEVIAVLCKQYNINSINLRQVKSRALRKLMSSLNKKEN